MPCPDTDAGPRTQWNMLLEEAMKEIWDTTVQKIMSKISKFEELIPMTLQPWLEEFENALTLAQIKIDKSMIYLAMTKFSYELHQQLQDPKEILGLSWMDFKKMLFEEFSESIDNG
uniref:Uncharacterized protein n=1 Tax=Moniliophthora roreri TaxID=221103 RepID=A0A0W0FPV5_MONRR